MRAHLTAVTAAGMAIAVGVLPAIAADPEPALVNEELVVAQVDASGLPTDATLYSRLVARDFPAGPVRDPSSITDVVYVDRRGTVPTDGDAVVVDIGGPGQTTVTTRATFDKPLPVALHAEYRQGPDVLAPDSVESTSGQMRISYTVTNTTAQEKTIRYRDAGGRWTVTRKPVFAPFVGTLMLTLPAGLTLLQAPKAVRSTTEDGRTRLLWNLVLYPPMGDYQQTVQLLVSGDPLAVPALNMQVMPVRSAQDPVLGFSTDLLSASVDGNADLADGLTELDRSAVALALGAGKLGSGLRELGRGTSTLTQQVDQTLVPGSQELAEGADTLATGQRDAAKGAKKLAEGQRDAAKGTKSAYDGARSLQDGAEQLSDGLLDLYDGLQKLLEPSALPSARDSSDQLAQAVLRLRDVIGTPQDGAGPFPPTQASTLIEAVLATQKISGISAAGADPVHTNLKDIAEKLTQLAADSAQAAALAGTAATRTTAVYQQACVDAVLLSPAQCAELQQAAAEADQARQGATDVGLGVGQQALRVGAQALAVRAIALALQGITAALGALDAALTQISVALVSGTTDAPGVFEGLTALTDGLTATIDGLVSLSNGAAESAGGADELSTGTQDLTQGLDDLATGSSDLADGADDLANGSADLADGSAALADGTRQQAAGTAAVGDALGQIDEGVDSAAQGADALAQGADQLQSQGTSKILAGVLKASKDPAFARAYLAASESRAADALPYGAPDGAAGRVSYIYTMPGSATGGGAGSTLAAWGLLAVILAAGAAVAWRRLHPLLPSGQQPEPFAPPPGDTDDQDWFFRPDADGPH